MNIRPFSRNSKTLAKTSRSIAREENNLSRPSFLGRLMTR